MGGTRNVLVGVTGGVAVYKACDVVRELLRRECQVRVAMTPAAQTFVTAMTFEALSGHAVATELLPGCTDGEIDHIRLGRWCDILTIVPATANFLAKVAMGAADDLVSATLLALPKPTPVLMAPAMNQEMWSHPATQRNIETIREFPGLKYTLLDPVLKELACGEVGQGGLAEPEQIASEVERLLES